ncbi:porin [Oceanobacter antarcticus]|uniref:Porin n=1 Tax=Oceanobacter antarcticus TaxID=3133425 RepID=A0ABW8NJM9_9GAMM|tara:strand:+ start:12350 stop:13378 length:1029 start_codon:yes stop_codon:yes gene_type:complete
MKQTLTTLTGACVLVLSTQAIADTKPPQVYGTISARVVDFSDTNFIGQDVDSTPTLYEGIVGLKGLHILQNGMKLAYRFEADFAPIAEADGSESKYYGATSTEDPIFIRYAGAALITQYGLFAFGDAMSGVYSEFYAPVDVFEVNTQDSTPTGAPNGSRMWTQTKWSKDGLVYKTPVWNHMFAKVVYASIGNESGEADDLKIIHGVYKDKAFMFGVNLSVYDKTLAGAANGEDDRKRWVVASHYNWDSFSLAGVYEKNIALGSAGADFDVKAVTGTYTNGAFSASASWQNRETPSAGALTEDTAKLAKVSYQLDPMMELWLEAGKYSESDNDNIGVGTKVKF